MYLMKDSFMGQASQIKDKLKNSDFIIKKSMKKNFKRVFLETHFFKTACKITFRLFNR